MKKIAAFLLMCIVCCPFQASEKNERNVYIAKYKDDKRCAISYTFDDGMREHYTLVMPQLEKHEFKGTFWICGDFIENNNGAWLTWQQVKEMADKGHEMSNHSWSHRNMTELSREEILREIEKNDSILLAKTGILPKTFCYPYNAINKEVLELASANRVDTRTTEFGIGTASTPEKLEQWTEDLLSTESWGVAMIHGITEGYDAFPVPAVLWEHWEKVKNREDEIWVGTFHEVAAYSKEREQIRLEVKESDHRLTIIPILQLDKKLFNEPLTLVVEKQGRTMAGIEQDEKYLSIYETEDKFVFEFDPYGGEIAIDWGN